MIRPARPEEAAALSDLALRAKAHWGYDNAFLKACRAELTVTAVVMVDRRTFVLEESGRILGFYQLTLDAGIADVAFFFIDPPAIGHGLGARLWEHLVAEAKRCGATKLTIEADPYAEAFYKKMGAETVGTAPSASIPGRTLPLMEFALGAPNRRVKPIAPPPNSGSSRTRPRW